jgi:dihydrofolate reductase
MAGRSFTGLVYIGTSVDGFIAREDGDLGWLMSRGEAAGDAGYSDFSAAIDTMLIGRSTYEVVQSFGSWPYGGKHVVVLSRTLDAGADDKISVVRDLDEAADRLGSLGAQRVYIDGGRTIQACLAAGWVDELTISRVPVLLGTGASLFGPLPGDVDLEHVRTDVLGGGMVQTTYRVVR